MHKLAVRGVDKSGVALDLRGLPGLAQPVALPGAKWRRMPSSELVVWLAAVAGLLELIFSSLKGAGAIDWPWAWVLSPVWAVFAGVLLFSALFAAVALRRIAEARARAPSRRR